MSPSKPGRWNRCCQIPGSDEFEAGVEHGVAQERGIGEQGWVESEVCVGREWLVGREPRARGGLANSLASDPAVDVVGIAADVLADLQERDPSLFDESMHEAFADAEALGELGDVQQHLSGGHVSLLRWLSRWGRASARVRRARPPSR